MINPKVTIIIPAYNCEKFIETVIMSCINQDYKNKEIIIVDNESTDNTLSIINNFKLKFPDLIIDTAKNIYKYSWQEPVEKAWELMSGDYFTIIGADDIIETSYITKCVDIMLKNNLELMQSNLYCFSKIEGSCIHVNSVYAHNYNGIDELKQRLIRYCCISSPSVFYKSDILTKYKIKWDSHLYLGSCDYFMYCSLVDQGAYIYPANEFLGYFYRVHENQSSLGMLSTGQKYHDIDNSIRSMFASKWIK